MDRSLRLDDAHADDVELALRGLLPGRAESLPLRLPAAEDLPAGGRLILLDAESVPFAALEDCSADPDGLLGGALVRLRPRSAAAYAERELDTLDPGVLLVPTDRPLHLHDELALRDRARGGPVVLLALTGHGHLWAPTELVRALEALGRPWPVRTLPVPAHPGLDAGAEADLRVGLARAAGAADVLLPAPGPLTAAQLDELLAAGATLPAGFTPPAVEAVLRRARPPRRARGLVLLFTGLSGSGKSTVARGVARAVEERSARRVTLLDGDVVRTMLSAGLGFSRADRELNVRRIGWVAAQIARHGGTAVCAPIAPYASMRDEVRAMARAAGAEYVLVHISTPLEVCEARDRKGLYAKARRGEIPEFTGISDPYEVPDGADLAVDTAELSVEAATAAVWDLLTRRGLL